MELIDKWMDVSVPLRTGMVHWPGDPEPIFERISDIDQGAVANVTMCRMTAHSGTHMDAPCHFLAQAKGIQEFPLDVGIGPARVIEIAADVKGIGKEHLEGLGIQTGDRILLKTANSREIWSNRDFQPDFSAINASGAQFLVDAGVSFIGVDYLSVGLFHGDGADTHRILLTAEIWIVEGLNLMGLGEGLYDLVCLPLRIENADGAPARVVLRKRSSSVPDRAV